MIVQRVGKSVTVGDLEIEPIERSVARVEYVGGIIIGVASKEPVAIVIRSPAGSWRIDVDTRIPPSPRDASAK